MNKQIGTRKTIYFLQAVGISVEELADAAGLKRVPDVYVLHASMMTAASFHDDEGPHLIVTPQILNRLSERQLRGVLAHEISHIEQKDFVFFRFIQGVRLVTVTVSRVAWFMLILYFPVLAFGGVTIPFAAVLVLLAAPFASVVLQFAVMRSREMSADLGAVQITKDPEGLAQALEKIDRSQRSLWSQVFPMPRRNQPDVLRTHPSVPKRVEQLRALET